MIYYNENFATEKKPNPKTESAGRRKKTQKQKKQKKQKKQVSEHVKDVDGHVDAYILNFVNLLNFLEYYSE